MFIFIEYLNADPDSIISQLKDSRTKSIFDEEEENETETERSRWATFGWDTRAFPSTLEALSKFTHKVDASLTILVLKRATQTLDKYKTAGLLAPKILVQTHLVLTELLNTGSSSTDLIQLVKELQNRLESELSEILSDPDKSSLLKLDLLASMASILCGKSKTVDTHLLQQVSRCISLGTNNSVRTAVSVLAVMSHHRCSPEVQNSIELLMSLPFEKTVCVCGPQELAELSSLIQAVPNLAVNKQGEFSQYYYRHLKSIISTGNPGLARSIVFSLAKSGMRHSSLPKELQLALDEFFRKILSSPAEFLKDQYQIPLSILAFSRLLHPDSESYPAGYELICKFVSKLGPTEHSNLMNKLADLILQANSSTDSGNSSVGELSVQFVLLYQKLLNESFQVWHQTPGLIAYWMNTLCQLELRKLLSSDSLQAGSASNTFLLLVSQCLEQMQEKLGKDPNYQVCLGKAGKIVTPGVLKRLFKELEELELGKDLGTLKIALASEKKQGVLLNAKPENAIELIEMFESSQAADELTSSDSSTYFRDDLLKQASTRKLFFKIKDELVTRKLSSTNTLTRLFNLLMYTWRNSPKEEQKDLEKLKKTGTSFGLLKGFTPKQESRTNPLLTSISKEEVADILGIVEEMVGPVLHPGVPWGRPHARTEGALDC